MKYIFVFMIVMSFVISFFNGSMEATNEAMMSGATKSIELLLSFAGIMCMWSGFLEVLKESGAIETVRKIISPFVRIIFGQKLDKTDAKDYICENISANLLGVGNAATPAGIAAMEELDKMNENPEYASDEMSVFSVMNTASIQLIPTTVIALRLAMGSKFADAVILPVWISSFVSFCAAVFMMKIINRLRKKAG